MERTYKHSPEVREYFRTVKAEYRAKQKTPKNNEGGAAKPASQSSHPPEQTPSRGELNG